MSELVGRFLGFEEQLGRDLVKFVYYVLLVLLVVTTLYELVTALFGMFGHFPRGFWPNLWSFLVLIPVKFFVSLLILRVGAELVIAVLSIDDNLRPGSPLDDSMSSGINPITPSAMRTEPSPAPAPAAEETDEPARAPAAKKTTKKRSTKKAAKKAAPAAPNSSEDSAPALEEDRSSPETDSEDKGSSVETEEPSRKD